jgi:hypothetical protein
MAATSNHYGDVAKWIEKVIDSCKTTDQLTGAFALINNFGTMFPAHYSSLFLPLWSRADDRWNEIIEERHK